MFDLEEFRLWLIDRFEPEELLMYLNLETDDILEMFPEQWEENAVLIKMSGLIGEDDDDSEVR